MFEGDEIIQQDVTTEDSSAPQESSAQESNSAEPVEGSSQEQQVPFHQDPRIQDYLERQLSRQTEAYQRQISEMEQRLQSTFESKLPKQEKQANEFVQRLREINPAYAEYIEQLEQRANKVESVESRLARYEHQTVVQQYESTVDRLHGEMKTSPEVKDFIKEQLDAMAVAGRINMEQVPSAYKALHDKYSKLLDGVKRAERASYVQAKTQDSSSPTSQPKGKTPGRDEKGRFSGNRENDLAALAARAVKMAKAGNEI